MANIALPFATQKNKPEERCKNGKTEKIVDGEFFCVDVWVCLEEK